MNAVDTNVFVYALDADEPDKQSKAIDLIDRVARRVAQGGHSVPEDVVRRRFDAGLHNLEVLYKPVVDSWVVYDNSGPSPRIIHESNSP